MARETVSIALCTYNGEKFLREQLASLARQTRRPDEIILCDDRSTDRTLEVGRDAARELDLNCQIHLNEKNLGFASNFAQTAGRCSGDYVFFCDQDDSWLPEKIERHLAAFAATPRADLVASDSAVVDEALRPTGGTQLTNCHFGRRYRRRLARDPLRVFLSIRPVPGHAIAVRRRLLEHLFPIPSPWPHDAWACLLAAARGPVVVLEETLCLYRRHSGQTIGAMNSSLTQLAGQMGPGEADPFETEARNFGNVLDRLGALAPALPDFNGTAHLLAEKIRFLRARAQMRRSPARRPGLILRELVSRRYFTLGQGWLSLARDVLGK